MFDPNARPSLYTSCCWSDQPCLGFVDLLVNRLEFAELLHHVLDFVLPPAPAGPHRVRSIRNQQFLNAGASTQIRWHAHSLDPDVSRLLDPFLLTND